jgi:hypothetical protein
VLAAIIGVSETHLSGGEFAVRTSMTNRYVVAVWLVLGAWACSDRRATETATTSITPAPITTTTASTAEKQCVPGKGVLCPVDEGASDPSFAAYRQRLIAAIDKRNAADLLPLVDDHIRTTFGEGGGRAAFEQQLRTSDSPLWNELSQAVRLSGSFKGPGGADRSFWAPYVYANWPEEIDAFTHVAAIARTFRSGINPQRRGRCCGPSTGQSSK